MGANMRMPMRITRSDICGMPRRSEDALGTAAEQVLFCFWPTARPTARQSQWLNRRPITRQRCPSPTPTSPSSPVASSSSASRTLNTGCSHDLQSGAEGRVSQPGRCCSAVPQHPHLSPLGSPPSTWGSQSPLISACSMLETIETQYSRRQRSPQAPVPIQAHGRRPVPHAW